MAGINGSLLVYLIGSLPVLAFYAAGLSGWFYDYPLGLFGAILAVFLVSLVLLVLKVPGAPAWNVAGLWIATVLIVVRILYGVFYADAEALGTKEITIMTGVAVFAIAWASVWTMYFRVSERVAGAFT